MSPRDFDTMARSEDSSSKNVNSEEADAEHEKHGHSIDKQTIRSISRRGLFQLFNRKSTGIQEDGNDNSGTIQDNKSIFGDFLTDDTLDATMSRRTVVAIGALAAGSLALGVKPAEASHEKIDTLTGRNAVYLDTLINSPELKAPHGKEFLRLTKEYLTIYKSEIAIQGVDEKEGRLHKDVMRGLIRMMNQQEKNGDTHMKIISDTANEYGVPLDLAVSLALVESRWLKEASSTANAYGYWQFIKPTAKRFGLIGIDENGRHFDNRDDVRESTRAAMEYLKSNYDLTNEWSATWPEEVKERITESDRWAWAAMGYHTGEGAVKRYFERLEGDPARYPEVQYGYWGRRYVPQILAVSMTIQTSFDSDAHVLSSLDIPDDDVAYLDETVSDSIFADYEKQERCYAYKQKDLSLNEQIIVLTIQKEMLEKALKYSQQIHSDPMKTQGKEIFQKRMVYKRNLERITNDIKRKQNELENRDSRKTRADIEFEKKFTFDKNRGIFSPNKEFRKLTSNMKLTKLFEYKERFERDVVEQKHSTRYIDIRLESIAHAIEAVYNESGTDFEVSFRYNDTSFQIEPDPGEGHLRAIATIEGTTNELELVGYRVPGNYPFDALVGDLSDCPQMIIPMKQLLLALNPGVNMERLTNGDRITIPARQIRLSKKFDMSFLEEVYPTYVSGPQKKDAKVRLKRLNGLTKYDPFVPGTSIHAPIHILPQTSE